MLNENMKDIDLDCRKQTSAASMAGHLFQMKQLVLDLELLTNPIKFFV